MEPDEVVVRAVQVHRGPKVLHLLAEAVGQPGEPADLHSDREVLTLDVAGAHEVHVRVADLLFLLDGYDARR
jgi:hypothetical protein